MTQITASTKAAGAMGKARDRPDRQESNTCRTRSRFAIVTAINSPVTVMNPASSTVCSIAKRSAKAGIA